ncbi:MAG: DUF5671 domain-containing protein [Candidatus Limnocylindria bacterium]
MHTVRRLYVYLLSGVSLGVLLVGLNLLLGVLLGAVGVGRGGFVGGSPTADREQLSVAAALTVVGLLVWGIHWWLAERSLRPTNPDVQAEHGSTLRALYLSIVLGALLVFGTAAAVDLLRWLLAQVMGDTFDSGATNVAGSLSTLLVTAVAWAYHAVVRRRDMRGDPLSGAAAWLPRFYLYAAALAALVLLSLSIGRLLGTVLEALVRDPSVGGGDFLTYQLAEQIAAIVVLAVIWLGHWAYATRLVDDPGWRGASERPALLRLGYFVAAIGAGAVALAWFGTEALRAVLVAVLGAGEALGELTPADLPLAIARPLVAAIPWLVAWWLHLAWLRSESVALDDETRPATADRLDAASVALVGLGFGAVGIGWLVGFLVDVALGGSRAGGGDFWRVELSMYLAAGTIGFVAWAWSWARLQRRHAADALQEAGSTVRRSYLLIVLAAAVLSSIGSLAFVLYRLFGSLLGVGFSGNAVSAVSTPLGYLLVAGGLTLYHALLLRRDQELRAAAMPPEEVGAVAIAPAPGMHRSLVLSGPPGADLEAALGTLRAQLPPGFRLDGEEGPAG